MSKITSADCKKVLVSAFTDSKEKDWKRVSKYKNVEEQDVRAFNHLDYGNVLVVDFDGTLEIVDKDSEDAEPLRKKGGAADYIFAIADEGYAMIEEIMPDSITVMMTPVKFWEENGCMNDQPDYSPETFLPKEWRAEDVNECGTWVLQTTLTEDQVKAKLISLGCVWTQDFADFINGGYEE